MGGWRGGPSPRIWRKRIFSFWVDSGSLVTRHPAVTAPCQSRLLQALRERRADFDGRRTPPWWIVDDRRVGAQEHQVVRRGWPCHIGDRKSTRLNSSHDQISYAVFCLKKNSTSWRN